MQFTGDVALRHLTCSSRCAVAHSLSDMPTQGIYSAAGYFSSQAQMQAPS